MKNLLAILVSLSLTLAANAGVVGWFTSKACDWNFIQQTGGIRIRAPIEKDGRLALPVEYCIQGTVAITQQPVLLNSGLAVRRMEVKKTAGRLVICVFSQVVEKGSDTDRLHYASLDGVPPGSYEVFYETAGDSAKFLGRIEIK